MDLHEAAKAGDLERLRGLLAAGAAVDARDDEGFTALMHAARNGQRESFLALLGARADLHARGPGGTNVLIWAIGPGRASLDMVWALLALGADANFLGEPEGGRPGLTPLLAAVTHGRLDIARVLVEAGADVNLKDQDGRSPLAWALQLRNQPLADFLRQAGARDEPIAARPARGVFVIAAEQPAFQQFLRDLAALCGREPAPYRRRKGVYCLFLNRGDLRSLARRFELRTGWLSDAWIDEVLDRLQDEVRAAGFTLIQADAAPESGRAVMLLLFPTADQYAVLAARGTHGKRFVWESGQLQFFPLTNEEIAARLRELGREHPFALTSCSFEHAAGRFLQPVRDRAAVAAYLRELCPDVEEPLEEAAGALRFYLWWD